MKQFTTPTIAIKVNALGDMTGNEVLEKASKVIFTISDGINDIDIIPRIADSVCYADLTEEQTALLQTGTLSAELTIELEGKIFKTKTMKVKMEEAIRDEVI